MNEFRILPEIRQLYKHYRLAKPQEIAKAMSQGWIPVVSLNYNECNEDGSYCPVTQFIMGKDLNAQYNPTSGVLPELRYPQPEDLVREQEKSEEEIVDQFFDEKEQDYDEGYVSREIDAILPEDAEVDDGLDDGLDDDD